MNTLINKVRRTMKKNDIVRDERGLSTVEYVIILVLIAAAAIGTWVTFGGKVKEKIDASNTEMDKVQVEGTGDK